MDYAKASSIQKQIEASKAIVALNNNNVSKLTAELREMCTHPENMLAHTEHYFSGSYYDTACTTHYYHCGICGLKIKETTEGHSWYG